MARLSATLPRALAVWALLGAGTALAQSPAPIDPAAKTARSVTTTGQIKPPAGQINPSAGQTKPPGAPRRLASTLPKPVNEAEMLKAQKAAEARSKAWDAKMRRTMGSICHGC